MAPHLSEALTLARWLMRNTADAEDVVQDACVRAYRAINAFSGSHARTWVLTIVRNTAYTMMARRKAVEVLPVDDLSREARLEAERGGALASECAVTPESELIAKTDWSRLEAAINELPAEFRETLVLRDIQGLAYNEIANVTGAPVGTVMSRLARARRRLIEAVRDV